MKKIAIICLSYGWLPGEGGTTRFSYIAELLANKGYDVTLISSSFYHVKKKTRDIEKLIQKKYSYHLEFLYEPGYKKNVSIQRLYSHHVAATNLKNHLKSKAYDIIYCVLPPNNLAKIAAVHAHKKGVPFIVDIEDLWPEGWQIVFGKHKWLDLMFYPIKRHAEIAYRYADGVVGTSREYMGRAFKNQSFKKDKTPYEVAYVCIDLDEFDQGVYRYSEEIIKKEDEFWVTYAGTLGESYDIGTMILAAQIIKDKGYKQIKFLILGTGPLMEKWQNLACEKSCEVQFLGFVPYPKMAAYLSKSDILLNSYVKKAVQSIVTKIGDYLASGKPIINTCSSPEFREKVDSSGFGINVDAENTDKLVEKILYLYAHKDIGYEMGIKGRKVAENEFDRRIVYEKIVSLISKCEKN